MNIAVTNLRTYPLQLPGYLSVAALGSSALAGCNSDDAARVMLMIEDEDVSAVATLVDGDDISLKLDMNNAEDVSGVNVQDVGFQIKTTHGIPVEGYFYLDFGAFDDVAGVTAAAHATLDTAGTGSIIAGPGSNLVTAKTDAHGAFECELTNATDEITYLLAKIRVGSPAIDCTDYDSVAFSA